MVRLPAEYGVGPHLWASAPNDGRKGRIYVRSCEGAACPLILGNEFADEGGGTESHSDGEPGGAGAVFIP